MDVCTLVARINRNKLNMPLKYFLNNGGAKFSTMATESPKRWDSGQLTTN